MVGYDVMLTVMIMRTIIIKIMIKITCTSSNFNAKVFSVLKQLVVKLSMNVCISKDMDFKKSVPRDFIEFIKEAQKTAENGSSSFEHLRMEPVSLAIIQVVSNNWKRVKGNL